MSNSTKVYSSSLGQKLLMGLTGLFLVSFLIVHLSGNMLLLVNDGGEAFNTFAEFMATNIAIRTLEIVLLAGFILHIFFGLRVWLHNRGARPDRYMANRPSENSSFASRWAFVTGSIVFIFLVIHMYSFWVPTRFSGDSNSYEMVSTAFQSPAYDAFYIVALILLAFHLRHGFQSAFQTLGLRSGWRRPVDGVAVIFWLVFPVLFSSLPLYFLWKSFTGGN